MRISNFIRVSLINYYRYFLNGTSKNLPEPSQLNFEELFNMQPFCSESKLVSIFFFSEKELM